MLAFGHICQLVLTNPGVDMVVCFPLPRRDLGTIGGGGGGGGSSGSSTFRRFDRRTD